MPQTTFFLSYAREDSEVVLDLAQKLRGAGVALWLDQLDIVGGQRWDRAVEAALKACEGMIAVLSPESLASNNVMDEVSYAIEENKLIVPILLRNCVIPFRLRRVQYVDFTTGRANAFADLLRALGASKGPTAPHVHGVPQPMNLGDAVPKIKKRAARLAKHPSSDIRAKVGAGAAVETILDQKSGYALVRIPGGTFLMGSAKSDERAEDYERPQHEVTVPDFSIGRHPVTNEEWGRYLKANPKVAPPEYWSDRQFNQAAQPVVGVSWDDAQAYCKWSGLRLPSEAEWEYACRAGTTTAYWSGDAEEDLARVGWYAENSGERLHAVGEKPPNPFGLYDMHGNAWEWCEDVWHDYERAPTDGSAWTDSASPPRVYRGGSWDYFASHARSAARFYYTPGGRSYNLGVRLARECL